MLLQALPLWLQSILAMIEAEELLGNTIFVKMKNYLPVRNHLVQSLIVHCQPQWDAIEKVRKGSTQYRSA